jgi:hypothetical protein
MLRPVPPRQRRPFALQKPFTYFAGCSLLQTCAVRLKHVGGAGLHVSAVRTQQEYSLAPASVSENVSKSRIETLIVSEVWFLRQMA